VELNNPAFVTLVGLPSTFNIKSLFLNYYVNQVFDHEIFGKKFVNYTLRQSSLPSSRYLSANTKDKDLVALVTRSNLPHGLYFFHTNIFTGSELATAVNMKILSCQI